MDEAEFDDFYESSFRRITGQVYVMIGNWDEAADCVQEAFVRAWQHRARLSRESSPEAWVRTTAHRLAISRWRRMVRSRREPDRAHERPAAANGPNPDHVAIVAALRQVTDAQRRALVLHYVCDLPIAAIAAETGAAEGTVKAQLSRGRAALLAQFRPGSDPLEGVRHA
ncbi:sigma-70 family RNA polymerase sigma factor [Nocardioides terrisoli]|uniref:sigma-70 family RNA polymerase sigma factor n=1 Tax=Nocardioides terrisoli TaxID=3388267 RepID=UPI00287B5F4A|nr:sigma-70 family RNA polymerase sigma factor [Nocardioides marmorisolisilvae]